MKKVILSVVVLAFAVAAQAGSDAKPANPKDKPACCAAKANASADAKFECPMMAKDGKASCPAKGEAKVASAKVLPSPKAAADVRK